MSMRAEMTRYTKARNARPPARLGQRYSATEFLPEAGNTIVCHLDRTDPAHEAVLHARAQIMALRGAENFLFTPETSLHMTVFEGVIDTRRTPDAWPDGVDLAAPVNDVSDILAARLAAFDPPAPFKVRVTGLRPTGLVLSGATPRDDANMATWRNQLTAPFGYRHSTHDSYRFHMTFGYPVAWLDDDMLEPWTSKMQAILDDLIRAAPLIPLAPPAFCTFADMTHFERRVVLAG